MTFSELVTYITETKNASEGSDPPVFRLGDLCCLYKERLEQLGIKSPNTHATRVKEQLLFHIPELEAHHQGRDVLLVFKTDVGKIIAQASKYGEAMHVAKAAGIIRNDMLKHKRPFNGTFHDGCLADSVPASLLQFVCMIENGADIKSQLEHGISKSTLAISQLVQYNCFARTKKKTQFHRHSKDKYERVDVVFDVYKKLSLKSETRTKRGRGIRRRVTGTTKTPQNWRSFLRDDSNKSELFNFLADRMCDADTTSTIIVTRGDNAISNKVRSLDAVAPCSHEEADTRVFVHARDATSQGSKSITIKANDTNVVVIAVSTMPSLQELGLEKLWIAFGQGASAWWIPVHEVVSSIGPEKVGGIMFFHAFTGCDVVSLSGFRGKGKNCMADMECM